MSVRGESEREIQKSIMDAFAGTRDVALFRNSVGKTEEWSDGPRGLASRHIRYGLGKGSADLVGVLTVGGVGVAIALEVKTAKGRVSDEQQAWLAAAQRRGACAAVVRSVEDARRVIGEARARVMEVLRA